MSEAGVVLIVVIVVLGYFGRWYWVFDLFSHFRVQYVAALLLCGTLLLFLHRRRFAIVSFLFAISLGATLLPTIRPTTVAESESLKVVSFNVLTSNTQHQEVISFLKTENADLVFLMEINDRWVAELSELRSIYPYQIQIPREDNFGVSLLSKYPFATSEVLEFGDYEIPAIEVSVNKDSKTYILHGLHTHPPVGEEGSLLRNKQLLDTAARIAAQPEANKILMGDFNLTQFSPWFAEILRRGNLTDTSARAGISPTWMRHIPYISIPIDHALVSGNLIPGARRLGPPMGSDHVPLIITVAVAKP